ncbi:transposase [Staphylococcus kloosii]|uniref:Integrase catalytic domain-containing protein n=1 Tax=Staphylococcus kloosii TaxID=29384 RepID=A0ABQ0XIW2_9STAP|nr:hypothetical protein SKL01_04830 [Staphylococcus kloosii]SUM47939.1 transposase [Staphylococcus kloosii]
MTSDLMNTIIKYLKLNWSPELLVGRLLQNNVCFKTIYRWISSNSFSLNLFPYLRQKGKRQNPKETRSCFNVGKLISQRSKSIKASNFFVIGKLILLFQAKEKAKVVLLLSKKENLVTTFVSSYPQSMECAIKQLISSLPNNAVKTISVDRGKEFCCYKNIESQFDFDIYFAEPYSACQQGTNENSNGLLREFFPKKINLATVTQVELDYALNSINHRPRKCLNWKSSYEILTYEKVIILMQCKLNFNISLTSLILKQYNFKFIKVCDTILTYTKI